MRVEHWLLLGLLLAPPGCVPDRAPDRGAPPPAREAAQPLAAPAADAAPVARLAARDFAAIDRHALRAPPAAERSLDALAAYLQAPARDDVDRARAAYRWIADRIAYDARAYFAGRLRETRRAPEDVLRHRVAVCDGYAALFEALARRMGLEAVTVSGYAKGLAYRPGSAVGGMAGPPDHAWNAVRLGGGWALLDAAWGAGTLDRDAHAFRPQFEAHFFLTPPGQFIYRHLPEDARWQLLAQPLTAQAFAALPVPGAAFFRDGLSFASHAGARIRSAGELTVRIGAPPQVRLLARLLQGERVVAGEPTFVEREADAVRIGVRPPRPGDYTLEVLSKPDAAARLYESAVAYRIEAQQGVGGGAGFPSVYRPFAEREGRLEAPLRGRLPAGQPQRFRVRVPGAEEVVAAVGERLVALHAAGDAFEGELRVPRGPFILYARFPGRSGYAGLLRFEGT
jgi:Transglutaminase-like superfamily